MPAFAFVCCCAVRTNPLSTHSTPLHPNTPGVDSRGHQQQNPRQESPRSAGLLWWWRRFSLSSSSSSSSLSSLLLCFHARSVRRGITQPHTHTRPRTRTRARARHVAKFCGLHCIALQMMSFNFQFVVGANEAEARVRTSSSALLVVDSSRRARRTYVPSSDSSSSGGRSIV